MTGPLQLHKQRRNSGDAEVYEPAPDDPPALHRVCPVCPADVGEWCGGFGDVHAEREIGR